MLHDPALAVRAADPRPRSAVSSGVGIAGLFGMALWLLVARRYGMDGPYAALTNVAAVALPMVLWSVFVDKVHRNPSTGIDWTLTHGWRETIDVSLTKLAGLWFTWGAIAVIYGAFRFYWDADAGNFPFAMWCLQWAAPVLFVVSIPYILWLDRKLIEPRDDCWAVGAWLMGLPGAAPEALARHARAWAVKAFFLAFMLAIVPPGYGDLIRWDWRAALGDPVALANLLITFMFVIDVAFATVGYILTLRPLDSHIRTANPYAGAWTAALMCYPPFIIMSDGGPLDYHPGSADWTHWYAGHPWLLAANGGVLVALTGFYAWATVAFGLRFSNLTNRGILTHGPYALMRHPAYVSKNLFWWLATIPVLTTTGSWVDAFRNTALMTAVSGVYAWRAWTEERHLKADAAYLEYDAWIARNGLFARVDRRREASA